MDKSVVPVGCALAIRTIAMSKLIFAAAVLVAFYSAYKAILRAAERQREAMVKATARPRVEPRDLGTLREGEGGFYVPDSTR